MYGILGTPSGLLEQWIGLDQKGDFSIMTAMARRSEETRGLPTA